MINCDILLIVNVSRHKSYIGTIMYIVNNVKEYRNKRLSVFEKELVNI